MKTQNQSKPAATKDLSLENRYVRSKFCYTHSTLVLEKTAPDARTVSPNFHPPELEPSSKDKDKSPSLVRKILSKALTLNSKPRGSLNAQPEPEPAKMNAIEASPQRKRNPSVQGGASSSRIRANSNRAFQPIGAVPTLGSGRLSRKRTTELNSREEQSSRNFVQPISHSEATSPVESLRTKRDTPKRSSP